MEQVFFRRPQRIADAHTLSKLVALSHGRPVEIVPPAGYDSVDASKEYTFQRNRWGQIVMEEDLPAKDIANPLSNSYV